MLLAALIIAAVVLSCAFIVIHAEHDCAGEDCFVCEALCACARTLRQGSAAPASATLTCLVVFLAAFSAHPSPEAAAADTPISLKVKLSD